MHGFDFQPPRVLIEFNSLAQETLVILFARDGLGKGAGTTCEAPQSLGMEQELRPHRFAGSGARNDRRCKLAREYPARAAARVTMARRVRASLTACTFDPVTRSQRAPEDAAAKSGRDSLPAGCVDQLGLSGCRPAFAAASDRSRMEQLLCGLHGKPDPVLLSALAMQRVEVALQHLTIDVRLGVAVISGRRRR